ncbi:hypothetical protein B296_00035314 [Ensete ventricosum]|uniref:Uncharacterized protein n=1 Tax=Ensete ventricosum TaxID=4639 RepID=A0A426ZRT1_ENSVE|nr:hypothetical protein B296_00035314 [Ensete ventricosum]
MVPILVAGRASGGVIIFGDSTVDVGNNNHLLPHSRQGLSPPLADREGFCNGKLATDFVGMHSTPSVSFSSCTTWEQDDACVARLNDDAVAFNEKLDAAALGPSGGGPRRPEEVYGPLTPQTVWYVRISSAARFMKKKVVMGIKRFIE